MRQGRGRTSHPGPSHGSACAPFPWAAGALSPVVGRTTGSQCSRFHLWASHHQAVWHPRSLCGLARVGTGLTYVAGRDHRFSLLGQPCFSEWNLVPSFSGCFSLPLSFYPLSSPSFWFCRLSPGKRPVRRSEPSLQALEYVSTLA